MKTLVFADFHLGTDNIEDQHDIASWVESVTKNIAPDIIILDGDTFELILPIEHSPSADIHGNKRVLEEIVKKWAPLFDVLRTSTASEFVFIPGEHDYDIFQHSMLEKLSHFFIAKRVKISNHHYDVKSNSLIIHGHELDYNRIFDDGVGRISCIDGLTMAINRYLTQTPDVERKVRQATRKQNFSYWYGFGRLPQYIDIVGTLFGADRRVYENAIASVLKSEAIDQWLSRHKSESIHNLGKAAKTLANLEEMMPGILMKLYHPFFKFLQRNVDEKIEAILVQRHYADAPDYVFGSTVKNLILGHFHNTGIRHLPRGSIYNVSSPRVHVDELQNDIVHLHRDYSYAVIDGSNVQFSSETKRIQVPVSTYHKNNNQV